MFLKTLFKKNKKDGGKNRKKEGKVVQGRIFYMRKKDEWQYLKRLKKNLNA